MDNLLEKISSYHILNYILPGIVYCFLCNYFLSFSSGENGILENIFLYYAVGLVISRVGSVVIKPILKGLKIIKEADYDEFIEANENDSKINVLVKMNNIYRSFIAVILVFALTVGINYLLMNCPKLKCLILWMVAIAIFVLLVLSYRKQTSFISKRVEKYIKDKENNKIK